MPHRVVAEYTPLAAADATNIKVFVRARPLEEKGEYDFMGVSGDDLKQLMIKDPDGAKNKKYGEVSFQFDRIFWTDALQEEVFTSLCKPQVDHVLNGYNSCCFAYGQTGSGKTYSMFGEGSEDVRGMIPRSVEYLFQSLAQRSATHEVGVLCSFLEIYNDQIRDLGKAYLIAMGIESSSSTAIFEKTSDLSESLAGKRGNSYFAPAFNKTGAGMTEDILARPGLKVVLDEYQTMNCDIREDAEGTVFVKDLSLVPVSTIEEVMTLVNMGLRVRATHETKMNSFSSRSHTVFAITVIQRDKNSDQAITGVLNLVDLAGSERIKKSESKGLRLKEALHINSSLSALGKVITALDPSSENTHVPFRDSKLTRILQNSLGGNSYTIVLAAIHPHPSYYDECLSTLQFANRCRNVRNNPRVNYLDDNEDKDRKIRRLMEEINQLRMKISQIESNPGGGGIVSLAQKGPEIVSKLVQMLKKAGIEAALASDGGILLNGQKISTDDLGLAENSVGEYSTDSVPGSMAEGGGGGGGGGGSRSAIMAGGKGGAAVGGNARTKKLINDLQEANHHLQSKLKERKVVVDEQGRQLQDNANEIVKCQTSVRHKEYELKCLMEEKERCLRELETNLRAQHASEIEELLSHNKNVMQLQQTTLQNAPESFKVYTQLIKKATEGKQNFEVPIRQEFEKYLAHIDKSRVTELEHVKLQYDHWLQEKDRALEEFVMKFNRHRSKKSEQLRMCEKEIVRLYEYTEQIENILDGVEKGQYKVQQRQGHHGKTTTGLIGSIKGGGDGDMQEMGAVVLPKGLKPTNPLKGVDASTLELTKKIVSKHKQREEKLEKVKEEAFHRSIQIAARAGAATMGPVDPVLQQQIRDLLVLPNSENSRPVLPNVSNSRPNSAVSKSKTKSTESLYPPRSPKTAPGRSRGGTSEIDDSSNSNADGDILNRPFGGGLNATAPPGSGVNNRGVRIQTNENDPASSLSSSSSSSNYDEAEIYALRSEIAELKAMREDEEITLSRMAEELSGNDTVIYIKHLEGEIEKQKKLMKDLTIQLQNSKIANSSLTRMLEKIDKQQSRTKNAFD